VFRQEIGNKEKFETDSKVLTNVVYVVDKRYFNLFKTSCYSLIKNSTVGINIYILTKDNEFSSTEKNKIKEYFTKIRNNINIKFVNSKKYYEWKDDNLLYKSHWYDETIFLKSCIVDAIPSEVDWINYIDCDTLVIKNIDSYLQSTYPMPIAGVLDVYYDLDTDYAYISSAVYKTSLNYWRENNIEKKFDSLIVNNYQYIDQDIINEIFKDNKTLLPLKYNVDNRFAEHSGTIQALSHACIVHFGGPIKPDSPLHKSNQWHSQWVAYNNEVKDLDIL
jgi:lipopolysaccharide biosynthesis glycosyltransferase